MSEINREARKKRHQKLYEGHYHSFLGKSWFHFRRFIRKVYRVIKPSGRRLSQFMHPLDHLPAPRRLYTQLALWSIALLMVTSINVQAGIYSGGEGVGREYLSLDIDHSDQTIISDDEGYIVKNMPLQGESIYDQDRVEMVVYEVQAGDTLSMIAYRYGISSDSILYANKNIGNGNSLKVGQELDIPPGDGIYVTVESGDSILALVEDYEGDVEETKLFNGIEDDNDLVAGKELFIIGGEPQVTYVATAPTSSYGGSTPAYTAPTSNPTPDVAYYDVTPNAEGWIRPTSGVITQGYHGGHLAYDVADSSRPPILAAASGTVIKAAYGWNGGYGNYIVIDHGNGYTTLYAHNEELYVNVGDYVTQGQVISKMGNTGRVYGVTGIHLHIEITYNGVKYSPSIMGVW